MSKTWYPIINYDKCIECGACVDHCTHGVYNKEKAPRPVVINPDNCIEGCTGCGSLCPVDAIEYFGNTADNKSDGCGCGCGDTCEPEVKQEEETKSDCGCGNGGCCGG